MLELLGARKKREQSSSKVENSNIAIKLTAASKPLSDMLYDIETNTEFWIVKEKHKRCRLLKSKHRRHLDVKSTAEKVKGYYEVGSDADGYGDDDDDEGSDK